MDFRPLGNQLHAAMQPSMNFSLRQGPHAPPLPKQEHHMAYAGDVMNACPGSAFDFKRAHAVVVSGAAWNPCGHMLLNVGGVGGWYMHVAETRGFPRYMGEQGYRRYLKENGKKELSRVHVPLRNPDACMLKLEQLLSDKWTWFVVPNNCVAFVEDVLQAGGTNAGLYSNCPSRESFR